MIWSIKNNFEKVLNPPNNSPDSTVQKHVKENILKILEEFLQKKTRQCNIHQDTHILHFTEYCEIYGESKYSKQSKG